MNMVRTSFHLHHITRTSSICLLNLASLPDHSHRHAISTSTHGTFDLLQDHLIVPKLTKFARGLSNLCVRFCCSCTTMKLLLDASCFMSSWVPIGQQFRLKFDIICVTLPRTSPTLQPARK